MIDLAEAALLAAYGAGEITEVVDRQWQVGGACLADRLAIVPGLGNCQPFEIGLHAVSDAIEDEGALGGAGAPPSVLRGVRRIKRGLDVLRIGARDLADRLTGHRRGVFEIFARLWRNPLAADEVIVALGEGNLVRA